MATCLCWMGIDVHRVSGISAFDRGRNTCLEIGTTEKWLRKLPNMACKLLQHGCVQKWVGWNLINQNPAPCGKVQAADRSATLWRTDCQMAGHSHGPARTLVVSTLCPCHNSPVQHKTKQLWLPKQLGLLKFLHDRFPFKLQHNWTKLTDH